MPSTGGPRSRILGSTLGAPGSNTELGPPERMIPLGSNDRMKSRSMPRAAGDLAVDARFANTAGDQLRELGSAVENEDAVHALYQVVGSAVSPRTRSSSVSRWRAT